MIAEDYHRELSRCVRCGACKAQCPTYLTTLNETMGARGRVALLGELSQRHLSPGKVISDKIFSCMLCGACRGLCPTGINIPEVIYQGRFLLRNSFKKERFMRTVVKLSALKPDIAFFFLRSLQKLFFKPFMISGKYRHFPDISSRPFNKTIQVYRNIKKIGRIAIFAGCSVNYLYPNLGHALSEILLSRGFEVVVFKGELCCGAPLRSLGFEDEASQLAKKNVEHFSKVRAEGIISICPTCHITIREQYPLLIGNTINNIMDVNEFILKYGIASDLALSSRICTYHDPCHLSYGLGIREEPRRILKEIRGVHFIEMTNADECCGFAGLFSLHFSEISEKISHKKMESILKTSADTVVTSCPGCIMQLESLMKRSDKKIRIRHIIEMIDEAMQTKLF